MGWTIEVARTTAYGGAANDTAWPPSGNSLTWGASSALGFFGDGSGSPVTVGSWQSKTALVYSTTTPTITTYVNNVRFVAQSTGFAVSTGTGSETYLNRTLGTEYTTPLPSYGIKFGFSTSGSVTVTQASAWYGVVDNTGTVVGDSSNAGFGCRMVELTTTEGWTAVNESDRKKNLNINAQYRQLLPAGTTSQWFLALSLTPKSAGAKQGGVAIDITYS